MFRHDVEDAKRQMCTDLDSDKLTYSESAFRWFDGLVLESNSYDTFDPWTVFSTLTRDVQVIN